MVFYHDAGLQRTIRDQVDFCLVNLPGFDPANGPSRRAMNLDMRLAELTSFFSVFSFQMPLMDLMIAPSVDAALAAGTKDFCLIQTHGHLFYGYDQLSFAMKEALNSCDFLMGDMMPGGGYHYMHDSCVLVNRRTWEKLNRPAYGAPTTGEKNLFTPTAGAQTISGTFGHGWNAISTGHQHGYTVKPWSERLKQNKWHCNPHGGDTFGWLTAMDDVTQATESSDPALQATLTFLRNIPDAADAPKKVFVFNSESDADLPQLRYRPGLDCAFVLASGFKSNRILEALGFHPQTKVVFYDYSAPALALRRFMLDEWDGRDFGAFFAAVQPHISALFKSPVGFIPHKIVTDPSLVEKEFQREVSTVFTSQEHWLAHWQRFRKLPHVFIEVDMLRDEAGARRMITEHATGNTAIWMSDMFNSPNAVGKFSWQRRRTAFDMISDSLRERCASDLILGGAPALWLNPNKSR